MDLSSDIPTSSSVLPSVTTTSITSITPTNAVSGGTATDNGGGISSKGVCWAVSPNIPTISNSRSSDDVNAGSYVSNITGLSANTTYNVRAYASNASGTAYGSTVTFTTSAASIPVVDISAAEAIASTQAYAYLYLITTGGGTSFTDKGVCWNTTGNPTTSNSKFSLGVVQDNGYAWMYPLTSGTTYYTTRYIRPRTR
jgi:hypothetical protein